VSEAESHPDEFDEFKSAPIRLRSGNAFSMVLLMNHCLCGLSSNNYRHSIARQINIEHYDNNSKSPTSVVAQLPCARVALLWREGLALHGLPTQLNSINKDNAATQQDQPFPQPGRAVIVDRNTKTPHRAGF
jgi:hypothetical protein